ncbi:jg3130 [Pararge aegeria aegeria]|uniref:Jg3130 protein n=1 Tax=Pararge aegeria aegeria TaxID=348720 RepID=A0A8S4QW99_9NEOP|nr:jg3130 [Pararge aegeria aegeria]
MELLFRYCWRHAVPDETRELEAGARLSAATPLLSGRTQERENSIHTDWTGRLLPRDARSVSQWRGASVPRGGRKSTSSSDCVSQRGASTCAPRAAARSGSPISARSRMHCGVLKLKHCCS